MFFWCELGLFCWVGFFRVSEFVCVCTCLVALKGLGFIYSFVVVQGFKGSGFAPHSRLGRARDRIQHCAV